MKIVLTNTQCLKSPRLQILSYFTETEFSAENQRALHYEHWQRHALRFACGFCDQMEGELKAERIDLVSKWLNVFQACYIFLSSFGDPSLLAMVTIMSPRLEEGFSQAKRTRSRSTSCQQTENVFQSLYIYLSSFGDPSPVAMVRLCIVVLKEGFQEREGRKATPRADLDEVASMTNCLRA
jgi:hypothetical protein